MRSPSRERLVDSPRDAQQRQRRDGKLRVERLGLPQGPLGGEDEVIEELHPRAERIAAPQADQPPLAEDLCALGDRAGREPPGVKGPHRVALAPRRPACPPRTRETVLEQAVAGLPGDLRRGDEGAVDEPSEQLEHLPFRHGRIRATTPPRRRGGNGPGRWRASGRARGKARRGGRGSSRAPLPGSGGDAPSAAVARPADRSGPRGAARSPPARGAARARRRARWPGGSRPGAHRSAARRRGWRP